VSIVLRKAGESFHRLVASSELSARIYFSVLPYISRRLGLTTQQRLRNSINSVAWPYLSLRSQRVTLGNHTEIALYPHFQEFDLEAALSRRLHHEPEVFAFLESRMMNYHSVIEVGANIGVFTLFFSKWLAQGKQHGKVFAFEPSRRAFERLLKNLEVNGCSNVFPFNCAVGEEIGISSFFEPEGHLMNGSFDEGFASQFSSTIKTAPVLVVNGTLIDSLAASSDMLLLKVDAEGAESRVLRSLESFIQSHRPDMILEVLPSYDTQLNALTFLKPTGYKFFNITSDGLLPRTNFVAGTFRDYFLTASADGYTA